MIKPEEKAEIILWDWLKTKNKYIEEVYFNRTNKLNAPVFSTKGINKKPDFIIKINRGYGIEYIIVEIKNSKNSRDVHDSGKILMYYENYINKHTKYFIGENQIFISHFAIATENSPKGRLFRKDDEQIKNYDNKDDLWRKINSKLNLIPRFEYIRTSDFQRRLWAEWRNLKKRLNIERKNLPSIGIIISSPKIDLFPYLFTMWWTKKNKWGQRFWRL